jgi:hypothetical protein
VQEDALSPFAAQIVLEHYFKNKAILFVTFHFSIIKSIRLYDQTSISNLVLLRLGLLLLSINSTSSSLRLIINRDNQGE